MMLSFTIILYFTIICNLSSSLPIGTESTETSSSESFDDITVSTGIKPNLTFDEFFNYTTFPYLRFSPNGQYLLYQAVRPSWDDNNYQFSLWLYNIQTLESNLITNRLHPSVKPQWSPSGDYIALVLLREPPIDIRSNPDQENRSTLEQPDFSKNYINIYSIEMNKSYSIPIEHRVPDVLTWSHNDSAIYFSDNRLINTTSLGLENSNQSEQKQYTKMSPIYRFEMKTENNTLFYRIGLVHIIPFYIRELLFVPFEEKLVMTSISDDNENLAVSEIYSLDLNNLSSSTRLTNNRRYEHNLELSSDGKNVLFTVGIAIVDDINYTIQGLYSLNLTSGSTTRIGKDFSGHIMDYTPRSDGGVYILGQKKTDVHIYSQQSTSEDWLYHRGYPGTYESIASSSNPYCSVAFVYSSSQQPMEIFCANDIDNLEMAQQITYENKLFTERNLPRTVVYNWTNEGENRVIEGLLHYPPNSFNAKNLSLLVLIHGGPSAVSLDKLSPNGINWALIAASEGWLVLEPNYLGSTGYDDNATAELIGKPVSTAGRDILSGIDQLIADGIADRSRLAVGGCSFGGDLTNWLITQTDYFNAALSCSGSVEHVSSWGLMDAPEFYTHWFNGTPWEVPDVYINESPIYQLNRVHTPTLIYAGAKDKRVPANQAFILERGLRSRGIPVELVILPYEGHGISKPENGKIKVRKELEWLKKYGPAKIEPIN